MRQLDVTDSGRMGRVIQEAFTDHEHIDVVVSNAGFGVFGAAEDLTTDQVEQMIGTNLTAAIQLARLVIPHLRRQDGGRLMQVSSMGGHMAFPAFSLYHATKWGIVGFGRGLGVEGRPDNIRVTTVIPGGMRTHFFDRFVDQGIPMPDEKNLQNPTTVASAIVFAAKVPAESNLQELILTPLTETSWP